MKCEFAKFSHKQTFFCQQNEQNAISILFSWRLNWVILFFWPGKKWFGHLNPVDFKSLLSLSIVLSYDCITERKVDVSRDKEGIKIQSMWIWPLSTLIRSGALIFFFDNSYWNMSFLVKIICWQNMIVQQFIYLLVSYANIAYYRAATANLSQARSNTPKFLDKLFLIRVYWNPKFGQGPIVAGLPCHGGPEVYVHCTY